MILKEFHDLLLEQKPESAEHDEDNCPFCNEGIDHDHDDTQDNSNYSIGGGDMKTYTEDEFTAAVTEAVAPLQAAAEAKVAELQSEIDELRTSQARPEVEGQIAELQADLDKAEIRVAEAERKHDELVAYLEAEAAAAEQAALVELRRSERRDAVKAAAPFGDDYIDANLDRWVAMEDEAFDAVIEDWKAVSASSRQATDEVEEAAEVPAETAMSNVRNEDHGGSVAASVFAARNHGVDVRYL
jgi:DNA repair exonuclease SbcCD ATPase subunit